MSDIDYVCLMRQIATAGPHAAQLAECLLGMHKTLNSSPGTKEMALVGHSPVIPALRRRTQEDRKFKVIFDYIGCSRPAWAT